MLDGKGGFVVKVSQVGRGDGCKKKGRRREKSINRPTRLVKVTPHEVCHRTKDGEFRRTRSHS